MSIKFTIIITAEKKEKYILGTIKSCLEQSLIKKFSIIVVYSKLNNEKLVKSRFSHLKNLLFLKCPLKTTSPTNDQLYKIEMATKFLKDEWVLLLDGDDLFSNKKLLENGAFGACPSWSLRIAISNKSTNKMRI